MTLAIKADIVKNKIECNDNNQKLLAELSTIVPSDSTTDPLAVSVYQLDDFGSIKRLSDYKGLPSDENFLNEFLAESNDMFIKLMEIEDRCQ